jgi:hypothetical protein
VGCRKLLAQTAERAAGIFAASILAPWLFALGIRAGGFCPEGDPGAPGGGLALARPMLSESPLLG